MDIAGLSMVMSQSRVQNAVSISVLRMAMDTSKVNAESTVQMIKDSTLKIAKSADPNLGNHIDIKI